MRGRNQDREKENGRYKNKVVGGEKTIVKDGCLKERKTEKGDVNERTKKSDK